MSKYVAKDVFVVPVFKECFFFNAKKGYTTDVDELAFIMRSLNYSPTLEEVNSYFQKYVKGVLVCWSSGVRRVAFQFPSSIHVDDVTSFQRTPLHACAKQNDTVLIGRQQMRNNASHILLTLPVARTHGYKFRGFVDRGKHNHGQHRIIQYQYYPKTHRRRKRSVKTGVKKTEPIECGATKSCYRHGVEDCGHLSCEYFLSYSVKSDRIDLELSARAPGWVAVGFSSDDRMGGDEVIACAKTGKLSSNMTAVTYNNKYEYDPPERKGKDVPDILTLEYFALKDGFIYCRISRPISPPNFQDLTNTWFQLYASGHVSTGGDLEKHKTTPRTSTKLITTININNFYTSGSGTASMAAMKLILVILTVISVLCT